MNNLQHIVRNDTRTAMHVAVELCEQGDFDSVTEAVRWLMQERDENGEHEPMTFWPRIECELEEVDAYVSAGEPVHVLECSACGETCEHINGSYPRCPHCGAKVVER